MRCVPSPPLNQYIHYLYYLEGAMPFPRERILPSPTLDLKINLGGAFRLREEHQTKCPRSLTESWLTGISSAYHTIDWPPDMRLYGVRFKPGGAYPFLGLPTAELHNQVVSLDALWGRFASEIREQLAAAPTLQTGFALFGRLLLARLCEKPHEQSIVDRCIAEIARHHGALSIRALCDQVGISQNHLTTQFKRVVGISAKVVARLYRFEHVLRSVDPTQPVNWTQTALQCGYYDQPHFNREFLALTGHSPSTYKQLRRRVYRENALVDQLSLRNLPID